MGTYKKPIFFSFVTLCIVQNLNHLYIQQQILILKRRLVGEGARGIQMEIKAKGKQKNTWVHNIFFKNYLFTKHNIYS